MKCLVSPRTLAASATALCSTTATASAAKLSQLCCMTVLSVHTRHGSGLLRDAVRPRYWFQDTMQLECSFDSVPGPLYWLTNVDFTLGDSSTSFCKTWSSRAAPNDGMRCAEHSDAMNHYSSARDAPHLQAHAQTIHKSTKLAVANRQLANMDLPALGSTSLACQASKSRKARNMRHACQLPELGLLASILD